MRTRRCTCEGCPHPWRDPACPFHGDGNEPILASVAQGRAERRLLDADRHIRAAFDGLGLGWNFDNLQAYLKGSPSYQALGEHRGEVLGMVAAFALVAVERDRELRDDGAQLPSEKTEGGR